MTMPPLPWEAPGRQQGIDLSVAQRPNAALMKAAKAAGCIACDIKACDYDIARGAPFMDAALLGHLRFARDEDLHTGTYAFFKSGFPWLPQAEQYMRCFDLTGPVSMRPTIDWEDQDRIRAHPQAGLDGVVHWCDYVNARTGRSPTVYTGKSITDILLAAKVDATPLLVYDLWQPHYRWDPVTGHDYGVTYPTPIVIAGVTWTPRAWQCGGDGAPHLPGVSVPIDRDIYFFPTVAAYEAWCAHGVGPGPGPGPTLPFDLTTTKGIQGALKALGYAPGPVDGVMGPRTVQAVGLFQAQHALVGDGIVGPRTRAALVVALAVLP